MNKIVVIGKGTAGCQTISHLLRFIDNVEIEWHYDPNTPTQSVGEGSTIPLSKNLYNNLNFNYIDMDKIDSTVKLGIYKSGWGKNREDFLHQFPPPITALHFNAVALQNYVYEKVKDRVLVVEDKIKSHDDIDASFILDCSGKPESYDDYNISDYIPVNSAYITQCYWEYPRFQYTLTIARPYGWVFGIPLKNRCSIGYLFNNNINNIDEVKKDVEEIFQKYNLNPSSNTNHLNFKNYYRKKNYNGRVMYNGNASFFLEPLEATSIANMDIIQRVSYDIIKSNATIKNANEKYLRDIRETEVVIMLHYFAGSDYDTDFWKFATKRGQECITKALESDSRFKEYIENALAINASNRSKHTGDEYGTWWQGSFFENIEGLGIRDSLHNMIYNFK